MLEIIGRIVQQRIKDILHSGVQNLPLRTITNKDGEPYLERYYLLGRAGYGFDNLKPIMGFLPFTIYLHRFRRSDEDYELHNHPWKLSYSFILAGSYTEERLENTQMGQERVWKDYTPGMVNTIAADDFHNVKLKDNEEVWTLFIAGEKIQSWGFLHPDSLKFTPWKEFVNR